VYVTGLVKKKSCRASIYFREAIVGSRWFFPLLPGRPTGGPGDEPIRPWAARTADIFVCF
jgi:hypothetical protein